MAKVESFVMDTHATNIVAAVLDGETGHLQTFSMGGEVARRGVERAVPAPTKVPRASGDGFETDWRQAEQLMRQLSSGGLHRSESRA